MTNEESFIKVLHEVFSTVIYFKIGYLGSFPSFLLKDYFKYLDVCLLGGRLPSVTSLLRGEAVEAVEAVERLVCRGEGTVTAEEVRATAGARTRILERL